MQKYQKSPANYPEPKPICPYCKSNNIISHGAYEYAPGFYRFKCKNCTTISTYRFMDNQYLYFKEKHVKIFFTENYVPYDEWLKFALTYYTEEVRLTKEGRSGYDFYLKRYNILHNIGMEQPETTKNALEEKEGDN